MCRIERGLLPIIEIQRIDFVCAAVEQHHDTFIGCQREPPSAGKNGLCAPPVSRSDNSLRTTIGNRESRDRVVHSAVDVTAVARPGRPPG